MAEITQFGVAFVLAYVGLRSAGFWMRWGVRLFGILAIPLLAALFFVAQELELWEQLGSGVKLTAAGIISSGFYLMSILPVMTMGAALGGILAMRNAGR